MISSILFGILVFVPIILILVVIHEFGHYLTARLFRVHVHEFGFGFFLPLFKIYTGNTVVMFNDYNDGIIMHELQFSCDNKETVRLPVLEDSMGNLVLSSVKRSDISRKKSFCNSLFSKSLVVNFQSYFQSQTRDDLIIEGKIKDIDGNKITIASMAWSFNLIPLGGFVKLAGENNNKTPRSFKSVHQWKQSVILVSGSFVNLIAPILIIFAFSLIPHPVESNGYFSIKHVETGSYAEKTGFESNDIIIAINDVEITNPSQYNLIGDSKSRVSTWLMQRDDIAHIIITEPVEQYGIELEFIVTEKIYASENPADALQTTLNTTSKVSVALSKEIKNIISGESKAEVMGPIGMVSITSQMTSQAGIIGWGIILIVISINLGILNLLPIPSLDGGRLVFVIIEWIRGGKQLPERVEGTIHGISFIVLIILILVISGNDIRQLLQ